MKDTDDKNMKSGLIDAVNRVTQELLKTPRIKAALKIIINSIDPESAPQLVRTLMWEDAELFIAALGAVPDLINICILSGKEMMEQLRKYPPPLLDGVLARILERIDGKALGFTISAAFKLVHRIYHAPGGPLKRSVADLLHRMSTGINQEGESLSSSLLPVLQPFLQKQMRYLGEEASKKGSETNKLVNGLAGTLEESLKKNPDFKEHVCRPFFEAFRNAAEN